jgi:hypothetical protein
MCKGGGGLAANFHSLRMWAIAAGARCAPRMILAVAALWRPHRCTRQRGHAHALALSRVLPASVLEHADQHRGLVICLAERASQVAGANAARVAS